jgi:hypothetical protein
MKMEKEYTVTLATLLLGAVMLLVSLSAQRSLPNSFCLFSGLMAICYGLWSLIKPADFKV